ncbi:MAG: 50S ribosomal protein L17 [bacterium]|nr:50S ribosomal protein L17 [bacterium]
MRKRIKIRKFGRTKDQREAMLNSLVNSIFIHGKIKTTQAKAKELKGFAEKLITRAKKDDLTARRYVLKFLPQDTAKKLLGEIAPKYKERKGGYLRIINLGQRKSDAALMAQIELV